MKSNAKILVLGQNGFIGKNVFFFLKKKNFNLIKYSKRADVFNLIKKADIVINCAGNNKLNFYRDNVFFLKQILNLIKNKKIFFIQISSLSIYGCNKITQKKVNTIYENSIMHPKSIYGKSKLNAEYEIINFSKKKNFNYTIFRIGSIDNKYGKNNFLKFLRKIIKFNFFVFLNNKESILNIIDFNKLNKVIYLAITYKLFWNNIFNVCENITLRKYIFRNNKYNCFLTLNISNKYFVDYIISILSKILKIRKKKFNNFFLKNYYSNKKIDIILDKINKKYFK